MLMFHRLKIGITPNDFNFPVDGLNIRFAGHAAGAGDGECTNLRLMQYSAFCRANKLDRTIWPGGNAKIGIVTVGKSYLDTQTSF